MPWGLHTEDIIDMQQEGEVLLFMDANAKTGLMGEQISGNIRLLLQMVEQMTLQIVNGSEECKGVITRQTARKKGGVEPEGCPREMGTVRSKHSRNQDGI